MQLLILFGSNYNNLCFLEKKHNFDLYRKAPLRIQWAIFEKKRKRKKLNKCNFETFKSAFQKNNLL